MDFDTSVFGKRRRKGDEGVRLKCVGEVLRTLILFLLIEFNALCILRHCRTEMSREWQTDSLTVNY